MHYFVLEPKTPASTRLKSLLVVAETPGEALSYVPEEARDNYRVSAQGSKGVNQPAGLVSVLHAIDSTS